MPFREIIPNRKAIAPVRFGLATLGRDKSKPASAMISIATLSVQERLGWQKGDSLRLYLGEGSDDGKLKLERSPAGLVRVARFRSALVLRLGTWPELAVNDHIMVPVEFEVASSESQDSRGGGVLIIELPPFAFHEPKPLAASPQAAQPARAAAPAPGAPISRNEAIKRAAATIAARPVKIVER